MFILKRGKAGEKGWGYEHEEGEEWLINQSNLLKKKNDCLFLLTVFEYGKRRKEIIKVEKKTIKKSNQIIN